MFGGEKTCTGAVGKTQKPKKAPAFKLGDVVQDGSGRVYQIDLIAGRYGEVVYGSSGVNYHADLRIEQINWNSGHNLKKFTGKK